MPVLSVESMDCFPVAHCGNLDQPMNKWLVAISLLCLAGLFTPFIQSHDALYYFNSGSENLAAAQTDHKWVLRWDLYCAKADFTRAIELNPKLAAAYSGRARLEIIKGNSANALKDYASAIGLDPQDPDIYMGRARLEMESHDYEHALEDYEKVIALKPDERVAYRERINIKEMQKDFSGAVMERIRMREEFVASTNNRGFFGMRNPTRFRERFFPQLERALNTDTNFAWGYYYRGVVKSLTDDDDGALADFQRCQNFSDIQLKDYAAIQTWLIQMQAGKTEKAEQDLSTYCRNRKGKRSDAWQMCIAKFLLDQIATSDFFNAIDASDTGRQQSEYWYYTGMKHLFAGEQNAATDCFQKSLATKTRPFAVYMSAAAELNSGTTAE